MGVDDARHEAWVRMSGDRLLIEGLEEKLAQAEQRVAAFEDALHGFASELRAGGNISSAAESMEGIDWRKLADLFVDESDWTNPDE